MQGDSAGDDETGGSGSAGDLLAALRSGGAGRFDPVRFTFIESMARRARARGEPLASILEGRLQDELRALRADFARAREAAAELLSRAGERHPGSREQLRLLFEQGDFRGLQRLAARLDRAAGRVRLAALADRLNRGDCGAAAGHEGAPVRVEDLLWRQEQAALRSLAAAGASLKGFQGRPGGELMSISRLRRSQGRRRADRLLTRAMREAPADCGPLNPQMLVLRTLWAMRDISPDYLARLVAYLDTLFWLDAAEPGEP